MEINQTYTLIMEFIHCRCFDVRTSVRSNITIALVVGHYQDYVWLRFLARGQKGKKAKRQEGKKDYSHDKGLVNKDTITKLVRIPLCLLV